MSATPLPVRRVVSSTWGLAAAMLLVGCASSGDVEQTRQEQEQAKAKMRAELQQERDLAATMEKESEAQRAKAEKLEKGLKGRVGAKTPAPPDNITSQTSGTTLQITNSTADPVPVQITLGNSGNPASNYGISNIGQLPSSWGIIPAASAPTTQGIFILAGTSSVSFNSGTNSFSGNVAFGPTFDSRGCGSSSSLPNPCYPNAANFAEFTLNMAGETVDISDVNGANAFITINFTGQTSSNQWNSGSFSGANPNVTTINIQPPLSTFANQTGVFGWQATGCVNIAGTPPNPMPNCPAPVNAPSAAQLQTNAQCNIQRGGSAPTGGTVQIVFGGFTDGPSAPQAGCVAVYTISPASGSQNGGTTVTMTGWGLSQVTGVTFQGAAATIGPQSNTQLVVTTPACNFCTMPQPWNSNVVLNLPNGVTYTVPIDTAGPSASAAYVYTSN